MSVTALWEWWSRTLVIATLAAGLLAGPVRAQAPGRAVVAGRVLAADNGEPIRFSLIYLVPSDSAVREREALTDSAGAFVFRDVEPGAYRVRVERIGYEAEPGAVFRVTAGEGHVELLRSEPRPVRIAAITVSGEACYTGPELHEAPALAALWGEARKAAEARRLFDLAYGYTLRRRQELWRGRWRVSHTEQTLTHSPALTLSLEQHGGEAGYGRPLNGGMRLTAPELPELFGPSFLATHCLLAERDRGSERRIRFAPVDSTDTARIDIEGTIVLTRHYAVDRIEFRYLRGAVQMARGVVHYGDVGVPGGQLRFARELDVRAYHRPGGGPLDHATVWMFHFRLLSVPAPASARQRR